MKILITNDDGIGSDGLIRLAAAAKEYGEVWVVAPETQRSAASHSITLHGAITVFPYTGFPVQGVSAYACDGTPADCVRVGVLSVMDTKPDLILSGINYGYNAATDIQYSATAGAAFEGAFQQIRSVALSESADPIHETSDRYLKEAIDIALKTELEYGQIVNINFPHGRLKDCKGILTGRRVSHGMFYQDSYKKESGDESGRVTLMVDGKWSAIGEEDTDLKAIVDGYVSIGVVNNIS